MATFVITIDRSLCSGFGACADFAPDLVELGADGVAAARVGRSDDPRALDLASTCPMAAIVVVDAETGRQAA
jgi:ferredoxin